MPTPLPARASGIGWFVALSLLGALLASPARALTIDEAVATALERNPELHAARAQILSAEARLEHASRWVPSNPRLSVKTIERDPNGPGEGSSDLGVEISQEIWLGGKRRLNRRAGRSRVESASAMVDFLELSIASRTRRAFLELLVAGEALETARRAVEVAEELQAATGSRIEAGEANRIEVNSAAIAVGRAQSALAEARAGENAARASLRRLMADELPETSALSGSFEVEELDLPARAELLNRVVAHRADLSAAAADIAAAESELTLSRRQLIPNLTVFGFYEQEPNEDVMGLGVSMPLPVLHGFGGERKQARSELDRARIERDALLLDVRVGLTRGIEDYRAARMRMRAVSDQVLASAEENVHLTYRAFRAGEVGITAVASAQEALLEARRDYLAARRAFIKAATELERTSGGLLATQSSGRAPGAEYEQEDS